MSTTGAIRRKRTDEEVFCTCGHLYMYHDRPYDETKQIFLFTHSGKCSKCDCPTFKDKEHDKHQSNT
jgi:hypothetical protein